MGVLKRNSGKKYPSGVEAIQVTSKQPGLLDKKVWKLLLNASDAGKKTQPEA